MENIIKQDSTLNKILGNKFKQKIQKVVSKKMVKDKEIEEMSI